MSYVFPGLCIYVVIIYGRLLLWDVSTGNAGFFTPSRLGDQHINMSLYQHIDISTSQHINISTMTVPIGLVSTSPYVPFEMESMITDPVRSLLMKWVTSLSHGNYHFYGPVTTILAEICPDIYSVIQCFFRVSFVVIP